MKSNRWLLVGLSLPIIVLLGWFLYEQTMIWITPAPQWIAGEGQSSYHFCWILENWIVGKMEPVEEMRTARVTRGQADDIVERVLARHYGFVPVFAVNGPRLVRATFPDGQRRLAWYEVIFIEFDSGGMSGKATGVYVDALTGEPLLLIPDVKVGDPAMTCAGLVLNLPFKWQQCVALDLSIGYLFILAAIRGGVWLFSGRTFKQRRLVIAGIASVLVYGIATVFAQTTLEDDNLANLLISSMSYWAFFLILPILLLTHVNNLITYSMIYSTSAVLWFFVGAVSAYPARRNWLAIALWVVFSIGVGWISLSLMRILGVTAPSLW